VELRHGDIEQYLDRSANGDAVSTVDMPSPGAAESDELERDRLSSLQGLLLLSMLMIESGNERQILYLALSSVPSFGPFRPEGVTLADGEWQRAGETVPRPVPAELATQLDWVGHLGGPLAIEQWAWAYAFPLGGFGDQIGHLVVSGEGELGIGERFLLQLLAHQTGVALTNTRLHEAQRATAAELLAANTALEATVSALEYSRATHDRLTRVAVACEGEEGIARAVHELTGYPVAVEDRFGNLRAWAGPDRPDPYPKEPPARREQLLQRVGRAGAAVRDGGRLLAIGRPHADVVGLLVLLDPDRSAGPQAQVALEHGATVLAMELARLRSLADTELRVRRDLVEELLVGTDDASALGRARALGYDLERPHRVVVVKSTARTPDDTVFLHAVRRAARAAGVGSLMVARDEAVVVLADADQDWDRFRDTVENEVGAAGCRVGVGGRCVRPQEFPRSYREATFALRMQDASHSSGQATVFDQLGVYRVFSELADSVEVERFVHEWLAALLDYDARKNGVLVETLSGYLESGGSLEATSKLLMVHRSTLKYRLQRIREISGHDLSEPNTRFNLQLATRAWRTLSALRDPETS
jgi:sugar diacid utilization regulator